MRIDYTLIRSKRKTAAIYVRGGVVEVRAPLKMPQRDINKFVAAHEKWIAERLAESLEQLQRRAAFTLTYDSRVLYRGKEYPITAKNGNHIGFDQGVFYMPPDLPSAQIKAFCIQIYRMLAQRDLTAVTLKFAEKMGVTPSNIKINGAKTRWGSCSPGKNINFSWRLIMAEEAVIDYVVVHELAHLMEMNHSKQFWNIVAGVIPDYKERKARLHELQVRLASENWDI